MPFDPSTINAIDDQLGKQRQLKAALIAQNDQSFTALNGHYAREAELSALEQPSEEQAKELADVGGLIRAESEKIRKSTAEMNAIDAKIADLQQRRELAVEHQRHLSAQSQNPGRQGGFDSNRQPGISGSRIDVLPPSKEQILEDFSDWIRAKAIAKRENVSVQSVVSGQMGEQFRNDRLTAAFTQSGNSTMFPQNYNPVLIEFLRAPQIIRNLPGITNVSLVNGNYSQTRQTGTTSGNYLGEMAYATPSDPTVGPLTMTAKKCFYLNVTSGEALRRSSPAANAMIRNDLRDSLLRREDLEFIRGNKSATLPGGLKWYADQDAANQRITANTTVTVANINADLGRLLLLMANTNIPMTGLFWIMSNRTHLYLKNLRTTQENYAFPDLQQDILLNYPVRATSAIPNNLGAGTNESEVYLVKASEIMIGDTDYIGLDMSDTAAYDNAGTVRAAFSEDSVVYRLITETDTEMRHRSSVVYAQGVRWFA